MISVGDGKRVAQYSKEINHEQVSSGVNPGL